MQIVSNEDNLHEMSNPVFWRKKNKKNITSVLSAEFGQRVVKLRGLNTLGVFSEMFHKRDNFCDFLLAFLHIKLLLNRVCSKREEFAPIGRPLFR